MTSASVLLSPEGGWSSNDSGDLAYCARGLRPPLGIIAWVPGGAWTPNVGARPLTAHTKTLAHIPFTKKEAGTKGTESFETPDPRPSVLSTKVSSPSVSR